MKANFLVEIIENKMDEIRKRKSGYLEMLERGIKLYPQEYIIERIKECRGELDILSEILEEYEGRE